MAEDKAEERAIPNLEVQGNRVVLQRKDIPLRVNGKDEVVVIQKLSLGERDKIKSKISKTTMTMGQPKVDIDTGALQVETLRAAIIKAPFEKSMISELPHEVGDYLYSEYLSFAEPDDKKKDTIVKE